MGARGLAREGELGSVWSMARPLVYTSLRGLEADGCGRRRGDRARGSRPHRVVFRATAKGEKMARECPAVEHVRYPLRSSSSRLCSRSASATMLVSQRALMSAVRGLALRARLDDVDPLRGTDRGNGAQLPARPAQSDRLRVHRPPARLGEAREAAAQTPARPGRAEVPEALGLGLVGAAGAREPCSGRARRSRKNRPPASAASGAAASQAIVSAPSAGVRRSGRTRLNRGIASRIPGRVGPARSVAHWRRPRLRGVSAHSPASAICARLQRATPAATRALGRARPGARSRRRLKQRGSPATAPLRVAGSGAGQQKRREHLRRECELVSLLGHDVLMGHRSRCGRARPGGPRSARSAIAPRELVGELSSTWLRTIRARALSVRSGLRPRTRLHPGGRSVAGREAEARGGARHDRDLAVEPEVAERRPVVETLAGRVADPGEAPTTLCLERGVDGAGGARAFSAPAAAAPTRLKASCIRGPSALRAPENSSRAS